MERKSARFVFGVGVLVLCFLIPRLSPAQAGAVISGTITDPAGRVVTNAQISVKNVQSGKSIETQSNLAGTFNVPNVAPGGYEISVSAEGLATKVARVTVTGDEPHTMNFNLNTTSAQQKVPPPKSTTAPQANLPAAPSPSATSPSLEDLGITPQQTQGSAQMQEMLDKRTHMLKVHQTLGLITAIPMVATVITGPQAKAKGKHGQVITEPTTANLDFHIALGGLTTGLYWTTAYYSTFAPKVQGVKPKGAIRLHRALEWVHGPGMILTPVLGILAYRQENDGEKVHGFASQHGTVAYVTAAAYGASIVSVAWPIHLKFWK